MTDPHAPTGRSRRRALLNVLVIIVVALFVVAIRTWVLHAYEIPTASMEPTIDIGDRVMVYKLAYDLGSVRRGDIIVFARPPADTNSGDINDLIKRVIGLPGESLQSGPDGEILVDGAPIAQPWVSAAALEAPQPTICEPGYSRTDCVGTTLHLPKGEYFVMGDNRSDSDDSRYWGPVPAKLIVGRAFLRFWPPSRLHWF